jgi:hypothetical protein
MDEANGLAAADQFRLEKVLVVSRPRFNEMLERVCELYPSIEDAVEEMDGRLYCHFVVEPGDMEEYWQRLRSMEQRELHGERQRLYMKRPEVRTELEAAPKLLYAFYSATESDEVPAFVERTCSTWGEFWLSYAEIWTRCLRQPLQNRLHALARREVFYHMEEAPAESLIELVEEETEATEVGRPVDEGMWTRRRRLVVRLLLEEQREFDGLTEFYAQLAMEDEDGWGHNPRAVSEYFSPEQRLEVPRPTTLAQWEELARWFRFELVVGIERGGPPRWRRE